MEKIELWSGTRGTHFRARGGCGFFGEYLAVVDVRRTDDWIEHCVLYRTEDGSVVIHQMRLSLNSGVDVAEVHILPALDADAGEQQLSQHII